MTCNIPKPMVPVLNLPFLAHMLNHIKGHGVDHAILTVGYLPERVEGYFGSGEGLGMGLSYEIEETPLGTAGAVKNVERSLDGTFLVLNGDNFTDLDLGEMMRFHRERWAQVTIFLTSVDDPSAFGVVETDPEGRVLRFLEKPSPGETTSRWINGGLYLMEPEALAHVPPGEFHMFERGLFPKLLELGIPVYGYRAQSYWIDVGTPANYMRLHRDLLAGAADMPGMDAAGTDLSRCSVDPTATLRGHVMLGDGCSVGPGAVIEGPAVLGNGCRVAREALVQGSILWQGVTLERGANVRGSIVGDGVRVGEGVTVEEGCILGDNVILGRASHARGGTVLWPGDSLAPGAVSQP